MESYTTTEEDNKILDELEDLLIRRRVDRPCNVCGATGACYPVKP